MNVTLKDVTVQGNDGSLYTFDDFFVKARNIRYVQIPEDVTHTHYTAHGFDLKHHIFVLL